MDLRDRADLIAPDEEWSEFWIDLLLMGLAPLRLLRWILRMDFYLPNLGWQKRLDFALSNEIVRAAKT